MGKSFTSNIAESWGPFGGSEVDGTMVGPHLADAADIKSMPFFPTGTKSLLSKCLTPELWEKCKDRKDKFGFTFRQAIMSGCKWTNSGVGVYAGSHDSYYAFAPFMD